MPEGTSTPLSRGEPRAVQPRWAFRIVFAYEGFNVRVLSAKRVEIITPPSDPLRGQKGAHGREEPREQTGFWFELHDANGRPLYRRVLDNPIKFSVSLLSDDPEHPFTNQMIRDPRGDFMLIVPALDQAATLVLFASREREGYPEPAKEIARFDLKSIQSGGRQ